MIIHDIVNSISENKEWYHELSECNYLDIPGTTSSTCYYETVLELVGTITYFKEDVETRNPNFCDFEDYLNANSLLVYPIRSSCYPIFKGLNDIISNISTYTLNNEPLLLINQDNLTIRWNPNNQISDQTVLTASLVE